MKLSEFDVLLDELLASGDDAFSDCVSVARLEKIKARVDAACSKKLAAFEVSDGWVDSGARFPKNWLIGRTRMSGQEVSRQIQRGRHLGHFPLFWASWSAGRITGAHLDVVTKLRRPATKEFMSRDEALLVKKAEELSFAKFKRFCAYWDQMADPDGAEEAAMARAARRDVFLTESFDGMYLGQMTMDPLGGTAVFNELARLEQELFEEDWAKAKETLGRDPFVIELCRTYAQRRHDALVRMAIRSATAPSDGRAPAPLFSVLVDYETFHGRMCELAQGTVVTPGSLLPWLEGADIERAVFEPGGRVDVGIKQRLFSGATRRAIEIRDRECQHELCEEAADRCQCDHIVEYSKGGLTTQENGRLLCPFHNRLRNKRSDHDQRPPPRE